MKKLILSTSLLMLIITSGCIEFFIPVKINVDETQKIPMDEIWTIYVEIKKGIKINVELKVISGSRVDLLLFDKDGYEKFTSPYATYYTYYPDGTRLNIKQASLSFVLPKGEWYFSVDNTHRPDNGAMPSGPVNVNLKIYGSG